MSEAWLVLCIILVIIECATVNLVSIWFAGGALLASITAILTESIGIQVGVFVLSSIIIFFLLKPLANKFIHTKVEKTNLDRVIGQEGIVTEDISKLEPGEVKVEGKKWSALSTKKIKKGSKVEILSIEGVTLHVKEIKEEKEK